MFTEPDFVDAFGTLFSVRNGMIMYFDIFMYFDINFYFLCVIFS